MEVHIVREWEDDEGWIRPDDKHYFPTKRAAEFFVDDYNTRNAERNRGSWRMYQEYEGVVVVNKKEFLKHRHPSQSEWEYKNDLPDSSGLNTYVVIECLGEEVIGEYEFKELVKANKFIIDRNAKTDNDFRPPESQHYFKLDE